MARPRHAARPNAGVSHRPRPTAGPSFCPAAGPSPCPAAGPKVCRSHGRDEVIGQDLRLSWALLCVRARITWVFGPR
eukprot:9925671-Lingulodinium_polyedra.AAC.1